MSALKATTVIKSSSILKCLAIAFVSVQDLQLNRIIALMISHRDIFKE